jgi:hypothetical protein
MRTAIIIFFFFLLIFISCSYKSKKYFEGITDVTIPASAKVIRDEYNKMGSAGHAQVLEVKLEVDATHKLMQSIIKSHYYKQIDTIIDPVGYVPFIQHGKYKGLWYKHKNGYAFHGRTLNDRDVITATFDSIENRASFGIFADD